jgi:RND superfamily putative drug exporter
MLVKCAQLSIKAKRFVLIIWILLTIAGIFGAFNLDKHLTTSLEIPGSASAAASQVLNQQFAENTEGTFTVIYKFGQATPAQIVGFKNALATAVSVIPESQITQEKVFAGTLYANIGTPYDLNAASSYTQLLRDSLSKNSLRGALVTGPPAIKFDVAPILAADLHRGQLIALLLALVLLVLAFGFSWAVWIPILFGLATISTSLGIIYLLAQQFLMVLYVPNIVELIGLGLAIDYSLLTVYRYRQNIDLGEQRMVETMRTSGRTAVISGFTVAISLATLIFVPIPFVRSLGLACLVVPLVSVAAVATLQPILLSYLGKDSNDRFQGLIGHRFNFLTNLAITKPKQTFSLTITAIVLSLSSLGWLQVTPSSLSAIPAQLESAQALNTVTSKVGLGVITPHEIVIDLGESSRAEQNSEARFQLAASIAKNPEVFTVASGEKWPYVDATGQFMRLYVFGQHELGAAQTVELVKALRNQYIPNAGFPAGSRIYLGGAPAQGVDLLDGLRKSFPVVALVILLFTFLILIRTFRSILLSIKALVLGLISIGLSFSALVIFFKLGLGTYQLQQIEAWVLILLFVILFGLSMDYEIFIVSRIREARDRGASNEEAIREGMNSSGTVVTTAALIFITALSGLIFGHFAGLQQLGIGLAIGVLVDATIIRGLLLPSAMILLGKWNWWLPGQRSTPTHKYM